jgi:hypothetical protein
MGRGKSLGGGYRAWGEELWIQSRKLRKFVGSVISCVGKAGREGSTGDNTIARDGSQQKKLCVPSDTGVTIDCSSQHLNLRDFRGTAYQNVCCEIAFIDYA